MGVINAFWSPAHRPLQRWNGVNGVTSYPPNAAPSIAYLGDGIQDHRFQYLKRGTNNLMPGILGWYGAQAPMVANIVPSTIAVANIAAAAHVVSGTPMTLVAASGAGITVLSASVQATFYASPRVLSAGRVIDGVPTLQLFGAAGSFTTGYYDPATCVGRAVSITGSVSATGGNFAVAGYDVYGFPMTETIAAGAGAVTTNGKKAFKVVTSVTPAFTDAHNYSVGTADIFGFGLLATYFGDVRIFWNNAAITANTGFVTADTATPTSTTGDVRGTYAVQSASDGTKRLQIYVNPPLASIQADATNGLFGKVQA